MKKVLGIILLPLLYARFGFIFSFMLALYGRGEVDFWSTVFIGWFLWAVLFGFIMGNCGLMGKWTEFLIKTLKIKYEIIEDWNTRELHSRSVWVYPTLVVNGKSYKLTYAESGGDIYEVWENVERKAIMIYLFKSK